MNQLELGKVAIIGGGAGGCCTALELARTGLYNIYLLEKNSELMRGSSNVTPGRMGLGFHYADKNTAVYYLHSTLEFTKKFGTFRQDIDKHPLHPLRRGRYFIMKDSFFSKETILETYEALKQEYSRLVGLDSSNKLFVSPENFYRILEPSEYQDDVVVDNIEFGVETAEELLDWKRFRQFTLKELEKLIVSSGRIKVMLNTEVQQITEVSENYTVSYFKKEKGVKICSAISRLNASAIVNSSWYNISKFNQMLGVTDARKRRNRLKAMVTVSLPLELSDTPSMFFCMGPYCMFTNKGNGIGMITYAPETNIAVSSSSNPEEEFKQFFHISFTEKQAKGERIVQGVSKYIPKMRDARVIEVQFGIIQTFFDEDAVDTGLKIGDLDWLHDPKFGEINKRDYSGVEMPKPGYVINACMKLLYCTGNAGLVKEYLESI